MRLYPAYARSIAALRVRGTRPSMIGVLLSTRWHYFDAAPKVCIRPDEWAVGRWEFSFARQEFCIAVWGDDVEPVQFGELLGELMLAGPRLLWACDITGKWLYQGESPTELANYAQRLGERHESQPVRALRQGFCMLACEAYERAQLRELETEQRELARAIEAGRTRVAYLERRQHAADLARRIFSNPDTASNDLAA